MSEQSKCLVTDHYAEKKKKSNSLSFLCRKEIRITCFRKILAIVSKLNQCMRLFHGQNNDITRATNWTPELLWTMAIVRAPEWVREKTKNAARQILEKGWFQQETLFQAWLSADGTVRFWLEELIKFFWDHHKFSRVYWAVNDALLYLCMRIQLERNLKKTSTHTNVEDILTARKNMEKRALRYKTQQATKRKAA